MPCQLQYLSDRSHSIVVRVSARVREAGVHLVLMGQELDWPARSQYNGLIDSFHVYSKWHSVCVLAPKNGQA